MQKRIDGKRARFAFGSMAELGRFIEHTPPTWNQRSSRTAPRSPSWDMGVGYDGAVRLAQDGWLEGAQVLQSALKRLPPATPRPPYVNDFYGFTPNVPRFCAGAPDSMIRHARDAHQGMRSVLALYVPVNAMGGVEASRMANYGAGVAQYVNQIETEGHQVELHGAMCSEVSGKRTTFTYLVKGAGQPMDLAVTAFAIGHPAMFRRLGFAIRERCGVREHSGYGISIQMKLTDIIDPEPGAVILNGMRNADTKARTPEEALKYITEEIEQAIANRELEA